jgi:hypothetical protein
MKYIFGILLVFVLSCSKKEEQVNKNLIFFKDSFLSELGNEDYEKLLAKTKLKIKAQYLDDLIIVTNYVESNACGKYAGDIRIKNDRIYLIYKLVSDEVCTSTGIDKVTYIINNPNEKKYKFEMEYK